MLGVKEMPNVLPLLVVAITTTSPAINLQAESKDPIQCLKQNPSLILIAQKHAGADPKGPDPHGDDPHDEQHDPGLPANQDRNEGKAPKDVYGGEVPNGQQPY